MNTPTNRQKRTCQPSTEVSWLFEEFFDSNVSDDGLSLAASFAINEQISKETSTANTSVSASDNGLSIAASLAFNEEISEETDMTDSNDSDDGLSLATSVAVIEQVSEEMGHDTSSSSVKNAGIEASSESILISSEIHMMAHSAISIGPYTW